MPLADHDVTLGLWIEFPPFLEGSSYRDPSQFPFYQNLSEVSGIDLSFTTVNMAAASEQFNLAVASQSFPDIVCNPGYNFMEDFINMDGTAVFSAASERFRDYVTMMHQWYQDGLIYKDYYGTSDLIRATAHARDMV